MGRLWRDLAGGAAARQGSLVASEGLGRGGGFGFVLRRRAGVVRVGTDLNRLEQFDGAGAVKALGVEAWGGRGELARRGKPLAGRVGEGVEGRARMVPLPIGRAVRARDDFGVVIAGFGRVLRHFCGARGLRVARHGSAPRW